MKFAWIFYKTGRLRVAISTANMVPYDWEFIENTVFIQDFLPKSPSSTSASLMGDDLRQSFVKLFTHLNISKGLKQLKTSHPAGKLIKLDHTDDFASTMSWDWSRVKVRLVMSVPGAYKGPREMDEWGLCRLGKVLDEEGWRAGKGEVAKTEYQGSSLGQYSLDWFDTFYQACCGKTAKDLFGRAKHSGWPPMKVLFPTLATVDASIAGRAGGGTMFCGKAMNGVTRHLFHDANSKRGGVLMHCKMLIAIFEPKGQSLNTSLVSYENGKDKAEDRGGGESGIGGWIYVGSHNFSSAAWGTINKKSQPPTLSIRNYEMGIVFPLRKLQDATTICQMELTLMVCSSEECQQGCR
ncbi:hypothetical protein BCR39DRAFT_201434 [Naematelia encephala]|uniref:Tyrosyl-DNA phosphodiesterase I n=1 Tax=Naematelia encephala TaxID=71784 RepID=A0A1Y2B0S1_9TREE|nr:hypothetical protein BCR39DRAFT_201434 [Naematelia encephala]